MKGKIIVIGLGASLLLGIAGLIALMGLQAGGPSARYLPMGTRPSDLPEPESQGAQLVARYCKACHSVPLPSLHYADDWPAVVDDMRSRITSRVMAPLPVPTPPEERELVAYFQRHAPRPVAVDAAGASREDAGQQVDAELPAEPAAAADPAR